MGYLLFFVRVTLLVVFSAAVFGKLRNREAWQAFVEAAGELVHPPRARSLPAVLAVFAETATIACLAINKVAYAGTILALAVLAVFLVLVLSAVLRDVRTACNCFGSDGTTLGWAHVWRNVGLTVLATLGSIVGASSQMPSLVPHASYATPVVLGLIFASVFVRWDDVTDLVVGPQP